MSQDHVRMLLKRNHNSTERGISMHNVPHSQSHPRVPGNPNHSHVYRAPTRWDTQRSDVAEQGPRGDLCILLRLRYWAPTPRSGKSYNVQCASFWSSAASKMPVPGSAIRSNILLHHRVSKSIEGNGNRLYKGRVSSKGDTSSYWKGYSHLMGSDFCPRSDGVHTEVDPSCQIQLQKDLNVFESA